MTDRGSSEPRTGLWGLLGDPNPWLLGGASGAAVAFAWLLVPGQESTAARVSLLVLSLLAAGAAVAIKPGSPLVLAGAAGVGSLGWLAMGPDLEHVSALGRSLTGPGFLAPLPTGLPWDSARLLLIFLSVIAGSAAVLLLLAVLVRRAVIGVVILFHFLGILSAVFSVPPAPWLATNLWAYVFRPYLEFMYLNNAYHFYSPDPGPPNLLWFRLEYKDGSMRWYKMPNREDYPTTINYQRRLSMTESTHHSSVTDPRTVFQRQQLRWAYITKIPSHPGIPDALQFREPNGAAKRIIQDYARYVAHSAPLSPGPGKVVKVRVYRVIHDLLLPRDLASGVDPLDRYMYRPHYQGEFDADGNLLDPYDPMLYWLVPIIKKDERAGWVLPHHPQSLVRVTAGERTYEVYDFLKVHAGDYQ